MGILLKGKSTSWYSNNGCERLIKILAAGRRDFKNSIQMIKALELKNRFEQFCEEVLIWSCTSHQLKSFTDPSFFFCLYFVHELQDGEAATSRAPRPGAGGRSVRPQGQAGAAATHPGHSGDISHLPSQGRKTKKESYRMNKELTSKEKMKFLSLDACTKDQLLFSFYALLPPSWEKPWGLAVESRLGPDSVLLLSDWGIYSKSLFSHMKCEE